MLKFGGRIFCQRCRAANSFESDLCKSCGTRLMLVVEPSGMRFEDESFDGELNDEHLLERITTLENSLARLNDRFSEVLSLLLKQTRSKSLDPSVLEKLLDSLPKAGAVERRTIQKSRRSTLTNERDASTEESASSQLHYQILTGFKGREREEFQRLVSEGLARMDEGKRSGGVKRLERALELDEGNATLNRLLGAEMFRSGRAARAVYHLKRAQNSPSFDESARLLLALSSCDVGDAESARELLTSAVENGASSFAAHYALGRLAAAESDWRGALAQFKEARARRDRPESHYLVGLAHYRLGQLRSARRQLEKATETDESYAAAHHLLGVVLENSGEHEAARASYRKAASLRRKFRASGAGGAAFVKGEPPSFFPNGTRGRRRLLTGADPRLDEFVREEALETFPSR